MEEKVLDTPAPETDHPSYNLSSGSVLGGFGGPSLSGREPLYPPTNFAMVDKGIYRSGYPQKKNIPFLKKLGIKSIIYLCPEEYPDQMLEEYKQMGIRLSCYGVQGNKEPFNDIPWRVFEKIIHDELLSNDTDRKPLLIHCNKGKHRTGCLVGCYRKLHGWTLASIFAEYQQFAYPKPRFVDQQFIEMFDIKKLKLYMQTLQHDANDNQLDQLKTSATTEGIRSDSKRDTSDRMQSGKN